MGGISWGNEGIFFSEGSRQSNGARAHLCSENISQLEPGKAVGLFGSSTTQGWNLSYISPSVLSLRQEDWPSATKPTMRHRRLNIFIGAGCSRSCDAKDDDLSTFKRICTYRRQCAAAAMARQTSQKRCISLQGERRPVFVRFATLTVGTGRMKRLNFDPLREITKFAHFQTRKRPRSRFLSEDPTRRSFVLTPGRMNTATKVRELYAVNRFRVGVKRAG